MIEIFVQNKAVVSTAAFVSGFLIFTIFEVWRPRREDSRDAGWRWINNLSLAAISIGAGRVAGITLSLITAWWAEQNRFGLLRVLDDKFLLQLLLGVVLLDLTLYLIHRLMHASPLLWRVHAVHHSDIDFDLTTALRNHPFNTFIVLGMRLPIIFVLGLSPASIAVYELVARIVDMASHTNVRLSHRIDSVLRKFVVTPDFHRNHHMSEKRLTNSNYATVFPVWDHLLGTASDIPYDAHEDAEIGLEYFRERRDTRLDQLLIMPFRRMGPSDDQVNASPVTGSSP